MHNLGVVLSKFLTFHGDVRFYIILSDLNWKTCFVHFWVCFIYNRVKNTVIWDQLLSIIGGSLPFIRLSDFIGCQCQVFLSLVHLGSSESLHSVSLDVTSSTDFQSPISLLLIENVFLSLTPLGIHQGEPLNPLINGRVCTLVWWVLVLFLLILLPCGFY